MFCCSYRTVGVMLAVGGLALFFLKGEKLGFKVTVLLAISVLLLILNEILPSTSNKTPLIDVVSSEKVCSYQDVLDHLNMTGNNNIYSSTRPALDYTNPTVLYLDVYLCSILAVIEKSQTFISYIWLTMSWNNERISWDPSQFCGITRVSVPKEMLWNPDIFISEMIDKNDAPVSPFAIMTHNGTVSKDQVLKVVSICKMDVHKFPFDTQRCNITFSSLSHMATELKMIPFSNSSRATQMSRQLMASEGEWEFLDMSVNQDKFSIDMEDWDQIVYIITIRRRPLLHVINLLLPVLFFLCLDLASYFISDQRGEKLGFKVTVLLAISVLLLILNEILPSTSNKTPLIATYCIVIFGLMLLSLLETILATYLMEKDLAQQEKAADKDVERRQRSHSCTCDAAGENMLCKQQPEGEEVNNRHQVNECQLLLILEELGAMKKTLDGCVSSGRGDGKPGYWTELAQHINIVFFIFYFISVFGFFVFMYTQWLI